MYFAAMTVLFLFGFVLFAQEMFGTQLSLFSDSIQSMTTLLKMIFGVVDIYWDMIRTVRAWRAGFRILRLGPPRINPRLKLINPRLKSPEARPPWRAISRLCLNRGLPPWLPPLFRPCFRP